MLKQIVLSISLLYSTVVMANQFSVVTQQHCMVLGDNPSLIIKFRDKTANLITRQKLKKYELDYLSTPAITFVSSRPMVNGSFIVFFTPPKKGVHSSMPTLVEVSPGCYSDDSVTRYLDYLKSQPEIESVIPNKVFHLIDSISSKSKTQEFNLLTTLIGPQQWNMLAPPGGINLEQGWKYTTGSSNVITAVLDTGVLHNASLTPNLIHLNDFASPGVYFNDNGSYGLGAEPSCSAQDCIAAAHGTQVTGIVVASGTVAYGKKVYGLATTGKVLPINIFSKFGNDVINHTADLINALDWLNGGDFPGLPAAPSTIYALNLSIGSEDEPCSVQEQFTQLVSKGKTIVVAAGNENISAERSDPANCSAIITVAATGPSGERGSYSNWGPAVAIAAPGGNVINSSVPYNQILSTIEHGYDESEGTSLAAPHVAGLAALMYSLAPSLNQSKVLAIMKDTATPFTSAANVPVGTVSCINPQQPIETCGAGIINAGKALELVANSLPKTLVLLSATRNPMNKSQGFIYYKQAKTLRAGYKVIGAPGATVVVDVAHARFKISNITNPKAFRVSIQLPDNRVTNSVLMPSILQ